MKPRKVVVMIETVTDAPMRAIRDKGNWPEIFFTDDMNEYSNEIKQIQVNVVKEPKPTKKRGE